MNAWPAVEGLFLWLVRTSGYAAVIAGIVLLAQVLLRKRLSPAWRYGLWFLLVARLLMPVTLRTAVSIFNLANWPHSQPSPTVVALEPITVPERRVISSAQADTAAPLDNSRSLPAAKSGVEVAPVMVAPSLASRQAAVTAAHPLPSVDWLGLGTVIWIGGTLILALRFVWAEMRFRRRLSESTALRDEPLLELLDQCARSLGVTQQVSVVETRCVESPAVYGLWRKRLLLPRGLRDFLPAQSLRHVLLHELAHLKRRDPELNWLLAGLQIVHWFNPVLWFAFSRMRADRELATDDLALANTCQEDRCSYGETILRILEGLTQKPGLPGLVGIGESKAQMKERLRAIAQGRTPRWPWAAAAAAVIIAGVALTNAREDDLPGGIDLLKRYPTTLTLGDAVPGHARPWQFTANDIFQVSGFKLEIGHELQLNSGVADLGIGHCSDGAVWAVLVPRNEGKLTSSASDHPEAVAHVWLRFHPGALNRIFVPQMVSGPGQPELEEKMREIAEAKLGSSWHAGNRVMIPELKDMTVDVDTKNGPRRFFVVDTNSQSAEYVAAFADRSVESAGVQSYEPEVDTNSACVVSVLPPDGASNVDPNQPMRIRFDRAMNPSVFKLEWLTGGFQLAGSIQVSPDAKEFTVPVYFMPGLQKLVLNRDQETERWIAFGRRPEMKPSASRQNKGGFVDSHGVSANEFRWSFSIKNPGAKPGAAKPRVTAVSPPSGATTPLLTLVQLTFDQPMRGPEQGAPFLQKAGFPQGPSLVPSFDYDASLKTFTIPALLRPDDDTRLTIAGFSSAEGVACDPVVLHYQTTTESLDPKYVERAKAAAKDSKLRELLASMKQARARWKSGVETVQTIRLGFSQGASKTMEAQTAIFKWQGDGQVYADIGGPMTMRAFILGSNGRDCWLYSENEKGEKRLDRTPAAVTEKEVLLLDPFGLSAQSIEEALAQTDLVYGGKAPLEGRTCARLERWEASSENMSWATLTQWWIDDQTFLPTRIMQYYPGGCQVVRFDYSNLNQAIAGSAFEPPPVPADDAHPLFFQDSPQAQERRFLRICDGSNGRMSGRIGWHSPNGTTSSGLN